MIYDLEIGTETYNSELTVICGINLDRYILNDRVNIPSILLQRVKKKLKLVYFSRLVIDPTFQSLFKTEKFVI